MDETNDIPTSAVELALGALVSLRSTIPPDALTASMLGTERSGNGVVIGDDGLVLTIGYLVTEAESIWITDGQGRTSPGHVVGYDQETGFGLVQTLQPLGLPHLTLGNSAELKVGAPVAMVGHGGADHVVHAQVIAKREFAGYWEYLLDEAIFTAPAHPNWGGAGLIGADARLYGIGSLLVQQVDQEGEASGANMIVPIDLLPPILDDLRKYGRRNAPARPWLGFLIQEVGNELVVGGVHDGGPASAAGLQQGDTVLEVDDVPVTELSQMYRTTWGMGEAGVAIPLTISRGGEQIRVNIVSADRNSRLKSAQLH